MDVALAKQFLDLGARPSDQVAKLLRCFGVAGTRQLREATGGAQPRGASAVAAGAASPATVALPMQ